MVEDKKNLHMIKDEETGKLKAIGTQEEFDLEEVKIRLRQNYDRIIDVLKKYIEMKEEYYPLVTLWIIGTYFHKEFESYPYLYFNAMRGSGKSRILRLITCLSKDGNLMTSPTEAVLFRTNGTLGIDEFEGVANRDKSTVRELLNASYKKGMKVMRMKRKKTIAGEEQVVEEFEPYRPVVMANIWGMDEVLGDRCIQLILEKSANPVVTKLVEDYKNDNIINFIVDNFSRCSICSVVMPTNIYKEWNEYVLNKHNTTLHTYISFNKLHTHNTTQLKKQIDLDKLFLKIDESNIYGRNLEIFMPIFLVSWIIDKDNLSQIIEIAKEITEAKDKDQEIENKDNVLIEFISKQSSDLDYYSVKRLTQEFKQYIDCDEAEDRWINAKWFGRALKRLNLIVQKRRVSYGMEVILNVPKAKEKLKMTKSY